MKLVQFAECRQTNRRHLFGVIFRSRRKMKKGYFGSWGNWRGKIANVFEYQLSAKLWGWHWTKILSFRVRVTEDRTLPSFLRFCFLGQGEGWKSLLVRELKPREDKLQISWFPDPDQFLPGVFQNLWWSLWTIVIGHWGAVEGEVVEDLEWNLTNFR